MMKKHGNKQLEILEKQKGEITISKNELEKIQKEIKNETIIPKEKKNELYKKIFVNIIFGIFILIYFIFMDIELMLAKKETFEIILKGSSIIFIICTIGIFEYAYKKESIKYTIKGIEMLVVSITTLINMQVYKLYNNKLLEFIAIIAITFSVYYIVKCIITYIKYKKEIKQEVNNIYKTAKRNEINKT